MPPLVGILSEMCSSVVYQFGRRVSLKPKSPSTVEMEFHVFVPPYPFLRRLDPSSVYPESIVDG